MCAWTIWGSRSGILADMQCISLPFSSIRRMAMPLLAALCATLLLTGCAGAEPAMDVATSGPEVAVVPDDGVARELFYAPKGFSVPQDAKIVEEIDQKNNITLVFSEPAGEAVVEYYREALPGIGMEITADADDALQFENDEWQGSVVGGEEVSAITMRTDWEAHS